MLAPIGVHGVNKEVGGGSQKVLFDYGGYPTTAIRVRGEGAMHLGVGPITSPLKEFNFVVLKSGFL